MEGPFRRHLDAWARGDGEMYDKMFDELLGYSTALICMQRLEGRHSILKCFVQGKYFQLPATLSAAMRRRQNKDLENPLFEAMLPDLLSSIGELHVGSWGSKTELLESLSRQSAKANHDPLVGERKRKEEFNVALAGVCAKPGLGLGVAGEEVALQREHLKAVLERGKCYAIAGLKAGGTWTLFRVLHTSPSSNMYLQRACHLSVDVHWPD